MKAWSFHRPQMIQRWAFVLIAALVFWLVPSAQAAVQESVIRLQAQVKNMYGKSIEQEFVVTLFEDDRPSNGLKPIAIVMHGRAAEAAQRSAIGRVTYRANAHWLAEQGFVVTVPTRIGYGVSGGEDAEDSGSCSNKYYPPAYQAAADQTLVARVPTLWIYTENDRWMGAKYPVQWHRAFVNAGGTGEFVQYAPFGKDGHSLYTQAHDIWRPKIQNFLQQQGLLSP